MVSGEGGSEKAEGRREKAEGRREKGEGNSVPTARNCGILPPAGPLLTATFGSSLF